MERFKFSSIMKYIVLFFSFIILFFVSCDLFIENKDSDISFLRYTINDRIYDSQKNAPEYSEANAYIDFDQSDDFISISSRIYYPEKIPFHFYFGFRWYYVGQSIINVNPTDTLMTNGSYRLAALSIELDSDTAIEYYYPIADPNSYIQINIIDTLNARYVRGRFEALMAMRQHPLGPGHSDRFRQLPDTFRVQNGEFLIELEDTRDEFWEELRGKSN